MSEESQNYRKNALCVVTFNHIKTLAFASGFALSGWYDYSITHFAQMLKITILLLFEGPSHGTRVRHLILQSWWYPLSIGTSIIVESPLHFWTVKICIIVSRTIYYSCRNVEPSAGRMKCFRGPYFARHWFTCSNRPHKAHKQ